VQIKIAIPKKLNEHQKKAMEEYAKYEEMVVNM